MSHNEKLTRYVANFVDELVRNGMTDVVISPGSRSTPLAVLFAEHESVKDWIVVDERSAAFFALGIAKQSNRPVALVCTSGTAAANYLPAIVEAYYSRVPLLVLTADRPHELRDIGAAQTIDQVGMYGKFVKKFWEMAPPEQTAEMLRYVRNRARRAMKVAAMDNPGPVQLNFPFREPLMPNIELEHLWDDAQLLKSNETYLGTKRLDAQVLKQLAQKMATNKKGLIVCGPQVDRNLADAIAELSETLHIPVLADPASQLRTGKHAKRTIITTYDTIFQAEMVRKQLVPDYIIRFGAMPISKNYLFFVKEHAATEHFIVENSGEVREPLNEQSTYLITDSVQFCKDVTAFIDRESSQDETWLQKWQKLQTIALEELAEADDPAITEGMVVRDALTVMEDDTIIFVGNSMPIRDFDTFLFPNEKSLFIHVNRGVSGIDGVVSSALGVAAASGKRVFLFIGDLSLYHDMNSLLLAKQYGLDLTVVLINNDGGGIFSFLPQAKEGKHFEHLFGTPLHIDFRKATELYGGAYYFVSEKATFKEILQQTTKNNGLSIVEVQTNRQENVTWHRNLWEKITQRLLTDA